MSTCGSPIVPSSSASSSEYVAYRSAGSLLGTAHPGGACEPGAPCSPHSASSTHAGTAIAVSLSQYWTACTMVIERIPPPATAPATTTATTAVPIQRGRPVAEDHTSPAAVNCGSRYSQPTRTTTRAEAVRACAEPSRSSAKSGNV